MRGDILFHGSHQLKVGIGCWVARTSCRASLSDAAMLLPRSCSRSTSLLRIAVSVSINESNGLLCSCPIVIPDAWNKISCEGPLCCAVLLNDRAGGSGACGATPNGHGDGLGVAFSPARQDRLPGLLNSAWATDWLETN